MIEKYNPMIFEKDDEVAYPTEMYVNNGGLISLHIFDPTHLDYAYANGINTLISWNLYISS